MLLIGDLRKLFEKQGLNLITFKVSETDPKKSLPTYTEPGITHMKTVDVPLSRLEELVAARAMVEADGLVNWLIS